MIVFTTNANGPCFSASAATTLHTTRVGTSIVLVTGGGISKICSSSPVGSLGTAGFSRLARLSIVSGKLRMVSAATDSLDVSGSVPLIMFGLGERKGVHHIVVKRSVKAAIEKGWL